MMKIQYKVLMIAFAMMNTSALVYATPSTPEQDRAAVDAGKLLIELASKEPRIDLTKGDPMSASALTTTELKLKLKAIIEKVK